MTSFVAIIWTTPNGIVFDLVEQVTDRLKNSFVILTLSPIFDVRSLESVYFS